MNTKLFISSIFLSASLSLFAQKSTTITLHTDQSEQIIPKEIYGQFAEHLGTCIYGGLWVGENSDIPNINGYRTDADREAGTGFPDVFHIKNILALFSGNFTHGDPLVLHTVALNQFDLVLCAVSQHRACFDLSRQNAFYDREIFPLHTIAPF